MNRYLYLVNPWWTKKTFASGTPRPQYVKQVTHDLDNRLIQIMTGLRRVGKSTIALQVVKTIIKNKNVDPHHILFFSIEEPSLAKIPIIEIINSYRREHDLHSRTKIYVFIDEIQFRANWEQEIKSLYDSENIKFVLTGSSAMLLSEKLSYLTGRYLKTQVFPLNFREYLRFRKIKTTKADQHLLLKHLETYLISGGMPEYVLYQPNRYLETTVESILFKDLVTKFQLRNPKILTDIIYLLADRVSTTSSSPRLSNILEVNKDTILTYLNYLSKTFIIAQLSNYSTSRNKELYNPPKLYFSDTGIASKYASKNNMGALVENTIYNHLNIQFGDSLHTKLGYYYENKQEVDFVLKHNQEIHLIESKYVDSIEQIDFTPLQSALKTNSPKSITYVTKSLSATHKIDNYTISLVPAHVFLLRPLITTQNP